MIKKKKKGTLCVTLITVLALLTAAGFYVYEYFYTPPVDGEVYTTIVSTLSNENPGQINRYAGVVEPRETIHVPRNPNRKIAEIYVSEGDTVHVGDPLFSYDIDEGSQALAKAELELERIDTEISDLTEQLHTLETEKETAPEDRIFSYTTEIQTIQNDIKKAGYHKENQKDTIEKFKKMNENTTVLSKTDGIVKQIFDEDQTPEVPTGENICMTILPSDGYRIKGQINEQNLSDLSLGLPILIYSRSEKNLQWSGTVTQIDMLNPASEAPGSGLSASNSILSSSNYHFYVEPSEYLHMFLGQHVFMEADQDQDEERTGIWLPAYYLCHDANGIFVWASNSSHHLEKRPVLTGDYAAGLNLFEITDGLSLEDSIAFPEDFLHEGMSCVQDSSPHKNIMITEALSE